jgi:hypothetical protein
MPSLSQTTTTFEKENYQTQDSIPDLADNGTMGTGMAPSLSGPSHPLADIQNNEPAEQCKGSGKRAKGLAVVGKGLTEKYVALKFMELN